MIQQTLRSTLRKILTSLIRILLRNGMSYGEFDRIARKCFVDAGFSDATVPGKKQTVSNVAILTGLNRKEVKKLREMNIEQSDSDGQQYNRVIRVLGGWINDPRFLRKDGLPRDLEYEGDGSFSDLIKQYSGDMPVAAMCKVLSKAGNIRFVDGKRLRLLRYAYLPSEDPLENLTILGADTSQLIDTIDFNLTAPDEALRFQRKATNHQVAAKSIPAIKQFLRRKGQAFLEELDLYLSQHETDDDSATEINVAVFYHESKNPDQESQQ